MPRPLQHILSNGLTLLYMQRSGSPSVSVSIRLIAGAHYEENDEIGVSHFVEHLVFDGTIKYPSREKIEGLIDNKGGSSNGFTNKSSVEYVAKVLKEDIETALEFLSQITIFPLLKDEDVVKEKSVITEEINRFKTNPTLYSTRLFPSLLFPDLRVGKFGTGDVADIIKITHQKTIALWERLYSAKNAVISIVGDIPFEQLILQVEKYFQYMKPGVKLSHKEVPPVKNQKFFHFERVPHLSQPHLAIGWRGYSAGDHKNYALNIITSILAGSQSSRLYKKIRGERALAYAVGVDNSTGRDFSILGVNIGTAHEKIQECFDIIRSEIEKICREPISQAELKKTLAFAKVGVAFGFENPLNEASLYSGQWLFDGLLSIEESLAFIEETIQHPYLIQEIAQQTFGPTPSILLLGDKELNLNW